MAEMTIELRGFLKEHHKKLYDFVYYCLGGGDIEDVVLETFRRFGQFFRAKSSQKGSSIQVLDFKLELFKFAWKQIQRESQSSGNLSMDLRDIRPLKEWENNFLEISDSTKVDPSILLSRFSYVELTFLAPLVLKDFLGFEDEEILKILDIRWGIFRHRLHRGRLELMENLRGSKVEILST